MIQASQPVMILVNYQHVLIHYINVFYLISVLVGLYEEPEKPNNALEYPFALKVLPTLISVFKFRPLKDNWTSLHNLVIFRICLYDMQLYNLYMKVLFKLKWIYHFLHLCDWASVDIQTNSLTNDQLFKTAPWRFWSRHCWCWSPKTRSYRT